MVVSGLFGLDSEAGGVRVRPYLPGRLAHELFAGQAEISLHGLTYAGGHDQSQPEVAGNVERRGEPRSRVAADAALAASPAAQYAHGGGFAEGEGGAQTAAD